MKEHGSGVILNVGWDKADSGMAGDSGQLFAAVKGAVMAFTKSLALSLAPQVRVNCLAPGWIKTAWGEHASEKWQDRVVGETPLERNVARTRAWYDFAVPDIGRSPTVERALAWLEANVPSSDESVLCWGDSRIGNVMYRDFEPVAVLDWEMAAIGPRELDVSWMAFAHNVFESITGVMGLPGMPDFMHEDDLKAEYERITGVALGDLVVVMNHAKIEQQGTAEEILQRPAPAFVASFVQGNNVFRGRVSGLSPDVLMIETAAGRFCGTGGLVGGGVGAAAGGGAGSS